jgi:hypothetical protein
MGESASSKGLVRVHSWEEFKQLVIKTKPDSLVYIIEQNGLSGRKETTVLRLILLFQQTYYIYLDFPQGNGLRETAVPIRRDKLGNRTLEDKDVVDFLKSAFERSDLKVYSFWTT